MPYRVIQRSTAVGLIGQVAECWGLGNWLIEQHLVLGVELHEVHVGVAGRSLLLDDEPVEALNGGFATTSIDPERSNTMTIWVASFTSPPQRNGLRRKFRR